MGEGDPGLGQPDELDGLLGGDRQRQGQWIGKADILAGEDHQPACDKAQLLTRMEHLGQPVEGGVGVATPEALDEGADRVVVIVARTVVDDGLFLDALGSLGKRDAYPPVGTERRGARGNLKGIQALAGIAIADHGEVPGRILLQIEREGAEAAFGVSNGPALEANEVIHGEGLELKDLRAGNQGAVDREIRVLRGRPDQTDSPAFNIGEQRILLRLVEAVDLIDEEERATALTCLDRGGSDRLSDIGHGSLDAAQLDETALGSSRDHPRETCLPGSGRAVKND